MIWYTPQRMYICKQIQQVYQETRYFTNHWNIANQWYNSNKDWELPRSSMLEAQTCKTDNGYLVVCILYHTVQRSWRFERLPLKIQTYHSACPHAGDNQSCCRVKHVSTVTCQQSWVPSPTYHQRPGMLDVPQGITILSLSEPHHFVKLSTWTKEKTDQKSMWAAHNVIYTV